MTRPVITTVFATSPCGRDLRHDGCVLHFERHLAATGLRRLTAALDCVTNALNGGAHAETVTVKAVSEALGCSEGALYRYVRDRLDLLDAVACRDYHRYIDELRARVAVSGAASLEEIARDAATVRVGLYSSGRGLPSFGLYLLQSKHRALAVVPDLPTAVVARELPWGALLKPAEFVTLECRTLVLDALIARHDDEAMERAMHILTVRRAPICS